MAALPLLGFGAFVLASLVVGARLLLLARRTGEVPELAIGTALFVGGGLGYGLLIAVFGLSAFPPLLATGAMVAGAFCNALGASALALGVRQIFRPAEAWARALQVTLTLALTVSFALRFVDPMAVPAADYVFWPSVTTGAITYGWSAFESLAYHARMRRRARLGLGDAAIARRFLLWGVAASAAVGIHGLAMVNRVLDAQRVPPAMLVAQCALGLVAAGGIWLAFFPPRSRRAALASG